MTRLINKKIIIDIPFNIDFTNYYPDDPYCQNAFNRSYNKTQTKEWIDYRIHIFMKYTANSLIHQTDQSFLCMVRYNPPTELLILDALSHYPPLPDNIIFTCEPDKIRDQAMEGHDYLYQVIIDSDNMYSSDFIQKVNQYPYKEGLECLLCHEGYIYDAPTERLALIVHDSPSFYVYIYTPETFTKYYKKRLFETHWNAAKLNHKPIPGFNYMIVAHEQNVDNNFDYIVSWIHGQYIDDPIIRKSILSKWHIQN